MATLRDIFDYQDFNPNERLSRLISDTGRRFRLSLSESELDFVNAAGVPEIMGYRACDDEEKNYP